MLLTSGLSWLFISLQPCFLGTIGSIHSILQPKPHSVRYRHTQWWGAPEDSCILLSPWNCHLATIHCAYPHAFQQITSDGQHINLCSLHIHCVDCSSGQKQPTTIIPCGCIPSPRCLICGQGTSRRAWQTHAKPLSN